MFILFKVAVIAAVYSILLSNQLLAKETGFVEAIENGETHLNLRLRHEDVEEQGASEKGAQATTLRSRLTFKTKEYNLFSALVEFDYLKALPDDENYNSGVNGQSDDAFVLDPEREEINRVWLAYNISNTFIKYGRQNILYDNGRFVGNEDWRQGGQTFSGVSLINETANLIRVKMAQLNRVENILGDDHPAGEQSVDVQLFNVDYRGFFNAVFTQDYYNSLLSFYAYFLDNESGADSWDSKTYGVRYVVDISADPGMVFTLEYANQEDRKDNAINYSADYLKLELGGNYKGIYIVAGLENLGADDAGFFVTPLASLHDFQGATGQFQNNGLGNISGGIKDTYISLAYKPVESIEIAATSHTFNSDDDGVGPGDLGKEWELKATKEWGAYRLIVKYAEYKKDKFGTDTEKLWVSAEATF